MYLEGFFELRVVLKQAFSNFEGATVNLHENASMDESQEWIGLSRDPQGQYNYVLYPENHDICSVPIEQCTH